MYLLVFLKKGYGTLAFGILAITFLWLGCKKTEDENPFTDLSVKALAHTDDQMIISNEIDLLANDFNNIIDKYFAFNGVAAFTTLLPCDASIIVDSTSSSKKITINYSGTSCIAGKTRMGTAIISLPINTQWKDAGAILTVDVQSLKLENLLNSKSYTINGLIAIKNVTGGLVNMLSATSSTITHEVESSNIAIKFDDSNTKSWQIAKSKRFTFNNGLVISITGKATVDSYFGVSEWGTNRYGNTFIIKRNSPIVLKQDCDFRISSGNLTCYMDSNQFGIVYGFDVNGRLLTICPGSNNFFYRKIFIDGSITTPAKTITTSY